jgi:sugar (pentulose or hexulose) kinase
MVKKDVALIVDFGTSGVKASLVDTDTGKFYISHRRKYLWINADNRGAVEIDPESIWDAAEAAVGELMAASADHNISVMCFSYFGDNIIAVDKSFKPLSNVFLLFDSRSEGEAEFIDREMGSDRFRSIVGNPLSSMCVPTKILWLKNNAPEAFNKAGAFISVQEYILTRLGLGFIQDYSMASRKLAMEIRTTSWSGEVLDLMGVRPEQMGTDIVYSCDRLGDITHFGGVSFPAPVPVIIGAHDTICGVLATGAWQKETPTLSVNMGTVEQPGFFSDEFINPVGIPKKSGIYSNCFCGPVKGSFANVAAFPSAGALMEWFSNNFLKGERPEAMSDMIHDMIFDASQPVMAIPHFEHSNGCLIGMNITSGMKDILQALTESIAFQLRINIEYLEGREKKNFSIFAGGGMAKSAKLLQLRANILNKTIVSMSNEEISSLGAAIIGAVGIGKYKDFSDAIAHMVQIGSTYVPDAELHGKYQQKYEQFLSRIEKIVDNV